MSSKGGRIKRTKHLGNLDSDDAPSLIDEQPNTMPAGRQFEKTTPSKSERVTTSHPSKDGSPTSEQVVKDEPCGQVNKQTQRYQWAIRISHLKIQMCMDISLLIHIFSFHLFLFYHGDILACPNVLNILASCVSNI